MGIFQTAGALRRRTLDITNDPRAFYPGDVVETCGERRFNEMKTGENVRFRRCRAYDLIDRSSM